MKINWKTIILLAALLLTSCGDSESGASEPQDTSSGNDNAGNAPTIDPPGIDFAGKKCKVLRLTFFPSSGTLQRNGELVALVDYVVSDISLSPLQNPPKVVVTIRNATHSGVEGDTDGFASTLFGDDVQHVEAKIDQGQARAVIGLGPIIGGTEGTFGLHEGPITDATAYIGGIYEKAECRLDKKVNFQFTE